MATNAYRQALNQARAELAALNQQFEELRRRKEELENVVSCLVPLSKDNATMEFEFITAIPAESEDGNARKSPNGTKDLIVAAITSANKPLSVPEIHHYATAIMQKNAPKPEAIRILMRRRTDTFEPLGEGLYTLRKWIDEANEQAAQKERI